MLRPLRGKRPPRFRRRIATCPPSRSGPATQAAGEQGGSMTDTATKPTKASEEPKRTAGTSPLVYARVAGFLLLFVAIIAPFSQLYVPSTLIVPGDATATADNIRASGWVLRLGIVGDSLIFLIEIAVAVIQGINLLTYFTALLLLSGAAYLTVFEPAQLDALALLFLNAHQYVVY